MLNVTFFGVRGSTPCPTDRNMRYGGNTSCVAVEAPGSEPIVFDLGTGLRVWGEQLATDGSFAGSAFVTHLHWDHVQGLPFFVPIDRPGARLDIYGPTQDGVSLVEAFSEFMRPPYFPIEFTELRGDIRFHDVDSTDVAVGDAKVRVRPVPHVGSTNGYRVDHHGVSVAYVSDHQQPLDRSDTVAETVLDLCDGVDLLIHDAQYSAEEWEEKAHWGHCSYEYAIHVAKEAGARTLALFHHDPAHGDDFMDGLGVQARAHSERVGGPEVVVAAEGLTINLT